MDENSYQIAEQIVQLHQKAYAVYLPLVEDVCSRTVPEDELSHLLDYLLDFACDEINDWDCIRRVCREVFGCIVPVVLRIILIAYQEMWGEENSYGEN